MSATNCLPSGGAPCQALCDLDGGIRAEESHRSLLFCVKPRACGTGNNGPVGFHSGIGNTKVLC